MAETPIGKQTAPQPARRISLVWAAITRAAQVDSANDPKRSAPIPATSPTLSPTTQVRKRIANDYHYQQLWQDYEDHPQEYHEQLCQQDQLQHQRLWCKYHLQHDQTWQ